MKKLNNLVLKEKEESRKVLTDGLAVIAATIEEAIKQAVKEAGTVLEQHGMSPKDVEEHLIKNLEQGMSDLIARFVPDHLKP